MVVPISPYREWLRNVDGGRERVEIDENTL